MTTYPTIDSARTAACHTGALITSVEPLSPADDAGFTPGCVITTVEGEPLRDIIDWRWYGSDEKLTVGYVDLDGDTGEVTLEREEGQSWGIVCASAAMPARSASCTSFRAACAIRCMCATMIIA